MILLFGPARIGSTERECEGVATLPARVRRNPHLPALFGTGDPETVARIKSDYRETLSDLHLAYMEVLQKWAESKGRTVRNQAHGSPSNLLDLYGAVGIPETETFGATPFKIPGIRRVANNVREDYPQPLINRMASSAAHVTGKRLVASELTEIRGIGPARQQALLNHFGSVASIKKAGLAEISDVPGMTAKAATDLKSHFDRESAHKVAGTSKS